MNRRSIVALLVSALVLTVGATAEAQGNDGYYVSLPAPRGLSAAEAAVFAQELTTILGARGDVHWAPSGETPAQALGVMGASNWVGRRISVILRFVRVAGRLRLRARIDVVHYPNVSDRVVQYTLSPDMPAHASRDEQLVTCARALADLLEDGALERRSD